MATYLEVLVRLYIDSLPLASTFALTIPLPNAQGVLLASSPISTFKEKCKGVA
jgi:hypothetical protein